MDVLIEPCSAYDSSRMDSILAQWDPLFANNIQPGSLVVLKPNWIAPSNKYNPHEWESVITHPALITSVLRAILKHLAGTGRVVITDGPQTQSSWQEIMARMTPQLWIQMGQRAGVQVDILDLREHEWRTHRDIIVS